MYCGKNIIVKSIFDDLDQIFEQRHQDISNLFCLFQKPARQDFSVANISLIGIEDC